MYKNLVVRNKVLAIFLILYAGFAVKSSGQFKITSPGITAGYGLSKNDADADIFRLGLRADIPGLFQNKTGRLGSYLEVSSSLWKCRQEVYAFAFSPVLVYYFHVNKWNAMPYMEAGFGYSYISKTFINDRTLSTHFQFEERLGAGVRTKKLDYNFRYFHFSNANIKTPNEGMDIFMIILGYYL